MSCLAVAHLCSFFFLVLLPPFYRIPSLPLPTASFALPSALLLLLFALPAGSRRTVCHSARRRRTASSPPLACRQPISLCAAPAVGHNSTEPPRRNGTDDHQSKPYRKKDHDVTKKYRQEKTSNSNQNIHDTRNLDKHNINHTDAKHGRPRPLAHARCVWLLDACAGNCGMACGLLLSFSCGYMSL